MTVTRTFTFSCDAKVSGTMKLTMDRRDINKYVETMEKRGYKVTETTKQKKVKK